MIKLSLICQCDCPRCDFHIDSTLANFDNIFEARELDILLNYNGLSASKIKEELTGNQILNHEESFYGPCDFDSEYMKLSIAFNKYHDCIVSVEKV